MARERSQQQAREQVRQQALWEERRQAQWEAIMRPAIPPPPAATPEGSRLAAPLPAAAGAGGRRAAPATIAAPTAKKQKNTSYGMFVFRAAVPQWDPEARYFPIWGEWSSPVTLSVAAKQAVDHSACHGFDLAPDKGAWSWGWWYTRMEVRLPALDADVLGRPVKVGPAGRVVIARKPTHEPPFDVHPAFLMPTLSVLAPPGRTPPGRNTEYKGKPWEITVHNPLHK